MVVCELWKEQQDVLPFPLISQVIVIQENKNELYIRMKPQNMNIPNKGKRNRQIGVHSKSKKWV